MERDLEGEPATMQNVISTHTLTWSVTFTIPKREELKNISTHTLTWSVTARLVQKSRRTRISTHTLTWSVTPEHTA